MTCLPQELLDTIIDEIQDTSTLQSCALVATSFVAPCQRKIFRMLYFHAVKKATSPRPKAFTESPHLAAYVRDLTIELPRAASEWVVLDLEVLRLVHNVERLVLDGRYMGYEIPRGAASALLDYLGRPSLRRLHLMNLRRAPSALIVAATLIPTVSLSNVTVDSDEDGSVATQPRLRHLALSGAGGMVLSVCNVLLKPRTLPLTQYIERLELRMNAHSRESDQPLLAACATTLQYLVLDVGALDAPITIPHLPLVHRLEIKILVGENTNTTNRRFPPLLSSTLSQMTTSLPLVEHITFSFAVMPLLSDISEWDAEPLTIFGPSFLAERRELRHLRQVHCRVSPAFELSSDGAHSMRTLFGIFVKAVEKSMPALEGTGILTCYSHIDPLS
ncbi:hypothetical protein DFH07DRAFT_844724 [Mycena maculata]|uniref:F-box domain-containing protein n=1 Tax=Mycena maculata TaxID=230809 RepID=A0AAD7MX32_9AGAR|nr:hypothetical protein DFH07DRAFT_844724 [Mycena maculata]